MPFDQEIKILSSSLYATWRWINEEEFEGLRKKGLLNGALKKISRLGAEKFFEKIQKV